MSHLKEDLGAGPAHRGVPDRVGQPDAGDDRADPSPSAVAVLVLQDYRDVSGSPWNSLRTPYSPALSNPTFSARAREAAFSAAACQ